MFKPGDKVFIRVSDTDQFPDPSQIGIVTGANSHSLEIETTLGKVLEERLHQAHESILGTLKEPVAYDFEAEYRKTHPKMVPVDYKFRGEFQDEWDKHKFAFDSNGHWKNAPWFILADELASGFMFLSNDVNDEEFKVLLDALKNNAKLDKWVHIGYNFHWPTEGCNYCGLRPRLCETDGKTIRMICEPCKYPNGYDKHNEIELNVPSGKITVANDMRKWFQLPGGTKSLPSCNTTMGCRQHSKEYEKVGLVHAFVGNTCPSVYSTGKNKFKVSSGGRGKKLASICTDLWWYGMCDGDDFARRVTKFGKPYKGQVETFDVKPGVYRFLHDDEADSDRSSTTFTNIEWVRDPDPSMDSSKTLTDWFAMNVNVHSYVQANSQRSPSKTTPWSEKSDQDKMLCWEGTASELFAHYFREEEWHSNGFPLLKIDTVVEDIDPPQFREQIKWYPFGMDKNTWTDASLNLGFAKMGCRVLESIISFGCPPWTKNQQGIADARKRMLYAAKIYKSFAAKYPEAADPDYLVWLSQSARVKNWVENFNYGKAKEDVK